MTEEFTFHLTRCDLDILRRRADAVARLNLAYETQHTAARDMDKVRRDCPHPRLYRFGGRCYFCGETHTERMVPE